MWNAWQMQLKRGRCLCKELPEAYENDQDAPECDHEWHSVVGRFHSLAPGMSKHRTYSLLSHPLIAMHLLEWVGQ